MFVSLSPFFLRSWNALYIVLYVCYFKMQTQGYTVHGIIIIRRSFTAGSGCVSTRKSIWNSENTSQCKKQKSTATHHLTFNGDTMGAKNKSKAEEKRPILFCFFCLEGAGVDTALYAPCVTRRTQGRKIYTCQKSCCCCCCATPATSARRSVQVVTYSKRLDPDTRRSTQHIVAICGACQTECYMLFL